LNADQLPEENCEELTLEDLKLESLFLGFRTKSGIKLTEFEEDFGCDLLSMENRQLEPLLQAGYLKIVNGSLKPTRKGMAIADSLALL
jgi:oxygen-independent coproporphyrinogen-3 oxidase